MNWAYILFSYFSLFTLSFLDNGRGPAYPSILEHFSITNKEGAYFFSLTSFVSILINYTARHWLRWTGIVNGNRIGLVFLSLAGFAISFAANQSSYFLLLLAAVFLGCGISIMSVTMNVLVVEGSTAENKRSLFSGLHAVYGVASFLAPFLFSFVISTKLTWSKYFSIVAIPPLLVFIGSFFMKGGRSKGNNKPKLHEPISFFKRVPFGLIFGLYVASELVVSSRLVLYLKMTKGFDEVQAGLYLSMFFAFLLLGRLTFALKHFPLKNRTLMFISLITAFMSFMAGIYIHPFFLSFLGFCMSYFFPISMDWLSDMFQEGVEFMTASVMTYIGIMLGCMHWGFGFVTELYGVEAAFSIVPVLQVLCLILLIFTKEGSSEIID